MMTVDNRQGRVGERWIASEAASIRRRFLPILLMPLLSALLLVSQLWLIADACHRVVIDSVKPAVIYPSVAALVAIISARSLLAYLTERSAASISAFLRQRIRTSLLETLLNRPPSARPEPTAVITETLIHGVDALDSYFTRFIPHLILSAAVPLIILVFAMPTEWRSSLVLLFSAPFIPLFMVLIGRGAESLSRNQWQKLSRMSVHLLDLLRGLPDLRMLSAVKREAEAVYRISEQYRASTMGVLRLAFLSAFTLEFFTTVGTAVIAVVIGFRLLSGALELRHGLFILLLAPEFYLPLRTLGLSYHSRMQGIATAEKIVALLDSEPATAASSGNFPLPAAPYLLVCKDLEFSYQDGRGALKGINIELKPGEIVALTGASGSGKSTLVSLLAGLVRPLQGSITLNGISIDNLDQDQLRGKTAWMAQKPFFYCATIRENLTIGLVDQDDQQLRSGLAAANALGFVERLPEGVHTRLGESGAGLSGGELRRLALVRLFLRSPEIVILDEPTAGLDHESEQLLCQAIRGLAAGRIVILISHREDTVRWADRVYRLEGGVLYEVGCE